MERFVIYNRLANKGETGYSPQGYRVSHYEGEKEIEGMDEWVDYYQFIKRDNDYIASLEESWWWGSDHNDGGCIESVIPREWFNLEYDEFLDNVLSLSRGRHYGFTVEELKKKHGLKEFFKFK